MYHATGTASIDFLRIVLSPTSPVGKMFELHVNLVSVKDRTECPLNGLRRESSRKFKCRYGEEI